MCRSKIKNLSDNMGMPSLRELDASHCHELRHLPEHGLTSLTSLTKLSLHGCACCCMLSLCSLSSGHLICLHLQPVR